jgi:energy-converting hydrogenase B subunit D
MTMSINLLLLFLTVVVAIAAVKIRDLLSAVILLGAYSFLMALVWVEMQSVDVGFMEATVGAGITTAFMIAALARTSRWEKK